MSTTSASQVIQGEVIRKLSLAQSALRTLQNNRNSPHETYALFENNLSQARELLKDLQDPKAQQSDPTLVLWVTSSLRQVMNLEDEYCAVRASRNSDTHTPAPPPPNAPGTFASTNAIMLHQQEMMRRQQDESLEQIEEGVGRLKQTSYLIRDELEQQHGMLETLSTEVDTTREKLRVASKKLDTLLTEMPNNGKICTIVVLTIILGILIVITMTM